VPATQAAQVVAPAAVVLKVPALQVVDEHALCPTAKVSAPTGQAAHEEAPPAEA